MIPVLFRFKYELSVKYILFKKSEYSLKEDESQNRRRKKWNSLAKRQIARMLFFKSRYMLSV